MISLIVIISFFLEGLLSKLISINLLFPSFTVISLIIIYPFLYNNLKLYYKICFISGIMYDIVYTNTLLLNAFCFLLLGYIIKNLNKLLTNNIFNVSLISITIIVLYRIIIYLILLFINYIDYNMYTLLFSIIDSLLLNIIYAIILFETSKIISSKKRINRYY